MGTFEGQRLETKTKIIKGKLPNNFELPIHIQNLTNVSGIYF